jgi:5-methylcytosine-specific restriction protein A
MPLRPPRICSCGNRVASDAICICQQRRKAEADKRRPSAQARGYDSKWQRESRAFLALPMTRLCACGCGRVADCVDHKIPHRGDMKLFWSRSNWQPMASSPCHSSRKQSLERRTSNRNN